MPPARGSATITCWRHVARLIKCLSIRADVHRTKYTVTGYCSGSGLDKEERGCFFDKKMYKGLGPFHQERYEAARGWGEIMARRRLRRECGLRQHMGANQIAGSELLHALDPACLRRPTREMADGPIEDQSSMHFLRPCCCTSYVGSMQLLGLGKHTRTAAWACFVAHGFRSQTSLVYEPL